VAQIVKPKILDLCLDLLKEFAGQADPVYWAGFTLVGDGASPLAK
jgi:hypothetical protein